VRLARHRARRAAAPRRRRRPTRLLEAMRARHAAGWYRTLTFVQRTVQTPPAGGASR
jgi:hypothetical protein